MSASLVYALLYYITLCVQRTIFLCNAYKPVTWHLNKRYTGTKIVNKCLKGCNVQFKYLIIYSYMQQY